MKKNTWFSITQFMTIDVMVDVVFASTFSQLGVPSFTHHVQVDDMTPLLEKYTHRLGVEVEGDILPYLTDLIA